MAHVPTEIQQNSTDRDAAYCRALRALQNSPGWKELLTNSSVGTREPVIPQTKEELHAGLKLAELGLVTYDFTLRGFFASVEGFRFLVWLDVNE